jgi:GT2 family glycosyltransferase
MNELLSIIIVNYRSWEVLGKNLELLEAYDFKDFKHEIIVVDNYSDDGQFAPFQIKHPKVKFILNSGNHGFAHGCHTGFLSSSGEIVLFLNPDTIAPKMAIEKMWRFYKSNSDSGIVSCIQSQNPSSYQKTPPGLLTLFGPLRSFYKWKNREDFEKNDCNKCNCEYINPAWISGSVVMISRGVYQKAGGWNANYWMYWEDVELSEKVLNTGMKLYMLCDVIIDHMHGGASRRNPVTSALTKTEVLKSQHLYFSLNKNGFENFVIQTLLVLNNLIFKFLIGFVACFFYFIPKMKVHVLILKNLIKYYIKVLKTGSWKSERAIN